MNLEEEKNKLYKIVNRSDLDLRDTIDSFLHSYIERDGNEECGLACLDLIKKMIIESSKRSNYDINKDIVFDTTYVINSFFNEKGVTTFKYLTDFNLGIMKNIDEYNQYIDKLINGKSYEEINYISRDVSDLNSWILHLTFKLKLILVNSSTKLEYFLENSSTDNSINCPYTKEELENILKIINSFKELMIIIKNNSFENSKISLLKRNISLDKYYSNQEFMEKLKKIMEHDTSKSIYYYHGTQVVEDAPSILEHGLGMMSDELSTTAKLEFDIDKLLLYQYGNGNTGKECVVIIDVPFDENGRETNIISEIKKGETISLAQSGNQVSLENINYYINSEHIVGYVDKKNMEVIFNPKYKYYDKFINEEKKL